MIVMRRGLTLVDFLVVLVLLLTLLGLLLTYIVRQRENAMRAQCTDNLRRLGAATRRLVGPERLHEDADARAHAAFAALARGCLSENTREVRRCL